MRANANPNLLMNSLFSFLFCFTFQDTKMDLLVTHLDTYSRLGIPKLHHLVAFEAEDEVEEGNNYYHYFIK